MFFTALSQFIVGNSFVHSALLCFDVITSLSVVMIFAHVNMHAVFVVFSWKLEETKVEVAVMW